jgi:putative transposase
MLLIYKQLKVLSFFAIIIVFYRKEWLFMIQKRAYKFRIYPNNTQKILLSKTFGCVRYIWNQFVESFNKKENPKSTTLFRKEIEWLKEVSSAAIQQKEIDFKEFKKQFFSKKRKKKIGKPVFKKKFQKQSYRLPNQKFVLKDNKIRLEKIGWISIILDREIPSCKFLSVTISKDHVGDYYASILVEEEIQELPKTNRSVGIDLGLKDFITTSDGFQIKMFNESESQARIEHLSIHLSRKTVGSLRFKKIKRKIAKIHRKIARRREWLHHNISSYLVNNYDEIVIEDLNVQGMMSNHKLARSIGNQGWSTLGNQIEYKSRWYGKKVKKVSRWFPSSKLCNKCGNVKKDLSLSERIYECECGNKMNRDLNASLNILSAGVNTDQRSSMECKAFNDQERLRAIPSEMINLIGIE